MFKTFRTFQKCAYSTSASSGKAPSSKALVYGVPLAAFVAGGAYVFSQSSATSPPPPIPVKPFDYKAVAKDISEVLEKDIDYDGIGHYGPILVRLAWHSAGTYDKTTKTGGSDGATMRFEPESAHGANAGLAIARNLLEPIKKKYGDRLSYGDLWTLAGVVAIKEMGGPSIPWRPGRVDAKDGSKCTPDGRLPDATKTQDHLRDIFYRMGFNDQEIVALSGAHALGKCHTDRSGFKGPWTFSPTSFTNQYFVELLQQKWVPKTNDGFVEAKDGKKKPIPWKGPKQFVDEKTGTIMMLPSDLALIEDKEFKKWVDVYAKDQGKFFEDFSKAVSKLFELGVSEKVLKNEPIKL